MMATASLGPSRTRKTPRRAPSAKRASPPLTPEHVWREHGGRVYRLARRMLDNDADAEDVTQDTLLQVVQRLDTFRGEAEFTTWLHRVTVNAALLHRRKTAQRHERQAGAPLEFLLEGCNGAGPARPPPPTGPEGQVLARETRRLIEGAIAGLPRLYRDVCALADLEGLANAEVAARLGLRLPAVKSRLHRARLLLRAALAPHFEEMDAYRAPRR